MSAIGLKFCPQCFVGIVEGKQAWCKPCKAAQLRKNRHRYKPEERIKKRARWLASYHLKQGNITRKPCEKCGGESSQMHHEDYSKPVQITWICRRCHYDIHVEERRQNTIEHLMVALNAVRAA